jgi:hypothetical protein
LLWYGHICDRLRRSARQRDVASGTEDNAIRIAIAAVLYFTATVGLEKWLLLPPQRRRPVAGDNLAALKAKLGLSGKTSPVSVN